MSYSISIPASQDPPETLVVTVLDAKGNVNTTSPCTFQSDHLDFCGVTPNPDGRSATLNPVAPGVAIIHVQCDDASADVTVTVSAGRGATLTIAFDPVQPQ